MKDLKYIIKRIIIGVGIALIMMLIRSNVFAASYRLDPSACYMYFNTGTTNRTGTVASSTIPGNFAANTCTVNTSATYLSTRYDYTFNQNISGTGSIIFNVVEPSQDQVNNVVLFTGGRSYACDLSSGFQLDNVNNSSPKGNLFYTVSCSNIPINQNRSYQFIIYKYNNGSLSSTVNGTWISRDFNFSLNDSSTISQAINDQSNQQHQDNQDTQQAISDVNDSITSSNTPSSSDTSSAYSNFDSATAQNGVITQLITLPITLFTNINNNINTSCTRFDMGTLLGTHIYFNCINPANYIGSQLWSVLDILASGFFVWYIGKKLVKVFYNLSSMKEGDPVGD